MKIALAVHGGAWNIPDALWSDHLEGCERAYQLGMEVLEQGGSALDAVATAIRCLEDHPVFDAGYGSFLNERGEIELDAGIMSGEDLNSGAVLGVSRIKNPIDLALHVLEHSPHCLFTAEGAHRLAERAGLPMVAPDHHIHPREVAVLARIRSGDRQPLEQAWTRTSRDTVGAVALDARGNLACGNSTGGTLNKALGRVGDAPLIGSGFYADNRVGAVVCTGWGEGIMRSAMAMRALGGLGKGDPGRAARAAVEHLQTSVHGFGGLLLMNSSGECAAAFNTERLACRLPPGVSAPFRVGLEIPGNAVDNPMGGC